MEKVIIDLWPILTTALIGVIIAYARYVHNLKERVAVIERTIEDLQDTMERTTQSIQKTIENIQKRQDSHSKKQDDIMDLLTDFKMEMLKEVGTMSANVSGLASDVKNLSNLISITDVGVRIDHGKKGK